MGKGEPLLSSYYPRAPLCVCVCVCVCVRAPFYLLRKSIFKKLCVNVTPLKSLNLIRRVVRQENIRPVKSCLSRIFPSFWHGYRVEMRFHGVFRTPKRDIRLSTTPPKNNGLGITDFMMAHFRDLAIHA